MHDFRERRPTKLSVFALALLFGAGVCSCARLQAAEEGSAAPKAEPAPRISRSIPSEFRGLWLPTGKQNPTCTKAEWDSQQNTDLTKIDARAWHAWENGCEVLSLKQTVPYNADNRTSTAALELSCGGEGNTNRSKEVWSIHPIGTRLLLTIVALKSWDFRDANGKKFPDQSDHGVAITNYLRCN
jgi:hypothetical protein